MEVVMRRIQIVEGSKIKRKKKEARIRAKLEKRPQQQDGNGKRFPKERYQNYDKTRSRSELTQKSQNNKKTDRQKLRESTTNLRQN